MRIHATLTTWPFLLSLIILLTNDWWLKAYYPGLITGKISDIAGVAIVSLLLFASNTLKTLPAHILVAGTFLWWKSPLSEPLISFINSLSSIRIGRIVDYSDLWALAIIPICHYVAMHQSKFCISSPRIRKIIATPVVATTLFAIMGTSVIPTRQEYSVRPSSSIVKIQRKHVLDAITSVSSQYGLTCKACSSQSDAGTFIGNGIAISYSFSGSNAVSFTIEAYPNGLFFGASGEEKANALRNSLKSLFAERFKGLEYVESLKSVHF